MNFSYISCYAAAAITSCIIIIYSRKRTAEFVLVRFERPKVNKQVAMPRRYISPSKKFNVLKDIDSGLYTRKEIGERHGLRVTNIYRIVGMRKKLTAKFGETMTAPPPPPEGQSHDNDGNCSYEVKDHHHHHQPLKLEKAASGVDRNPVAQGKKNKHNKKSGDEATSCNNNASLMGQQDRRA